MLRRHQAVLGHQEPRTWLALAVRCVNQCSPDAVCRHWMSCCSTVFTPLSQDVNTIASFLLPKNSTTDNRYVLSNERTLGAVVVRMARDITRIHCCFALVGIVEIVRVVQLDLGADLWRLQNYFYSQHSSQSRISLPHKISTDAQEIYSSLNFTDWSTHV